MTCRWCLAWGRRAGAVSCLVWVALAAGGCSEDVEQATPLAAVALAATEDGAACQEASECTSGYCVDGLCCESACSDTCSDGHAVQNECDGAGACVEAASVSCGAYACSEGTCRDACVTDSHCARTYECVEGQCVPHRSFECASDETASLDPAGQEVLCAPFLCNPVVGTCRVTCFEDSHCGPDFVCNLRQQSCESPPTPARDSEGGCRAAGPSSTASASPLLLLGLALSAALGRRRARH